MKFPPKSRRLNAFLISGALFALCFAAALILSARIGQIARALPGERAAQRFGGETAQMSVFFPDGAGFTVSSVPSLARQIDEKLTDASLAASAGARLWLYAYSTETAASAATERDTVRVAATVCGGDYFLIHAPTFLSGAALTENAAGDGAVVLDARAAYALFGAVNVAGSTVFIDGQPYTVAGVTEIPESRFYDGYGDTPRIFVLYSSPLGRGLSQITAWSAVLPEPVDGFASSLTEELFEGYGDAVTVENSARFTAKTLWETAKSRELSPVREKAIAFPWWENEARVAAYRASVLLTALACAAVPMGLILLLWIALLWKPTETLLARTRDTVKEGSQTAWERVTIPETRKRRPKRSKAGKPKADPSPKDIPQEELI